MEMLFKIKKTINRIKTIKTLGRTSAQRNNLIRETTDV